MNAEEKKAYNKAYYAANKDRIKKQAAEYYAKNAESIKVKTAAYVADNREKARASRRAHYKRNKEVYVEAAERHKARNPEQFAERSRSRTKKYRSENPERSRFSGRLSQAKRRARASGGNLSADIADRLFKLQRGKCACGCKQPLGDDYHLDHIMPLALGGTNTDDNIQLLRKRCNLQKKDKHPVEFMQRRGFLL